VASQTRLDSVREVIVSENGNNKESKEVCSEFTRLPIRYINRVPELDVVCHFETIVAEASSPWVALLGDDDMWSRYHLEEASRAVALYSDIAAFVGACAVVRNESCRLWRGYGMTLESILWPGHTLPTVGLWPAKQMHLESLVRTPLNMWGTVGRKAPLLHGLRGWRENSHLFDADRIFLCKLASQGKVAVGREIGLFYRAHPASEFALFWSKVKARDAVSAETTRLIVNSAEHLGINIREDWFAALQAMSYQQRHEYVASALPGAQQALVQLWGKEAFGPDESLRQSLLLRSVGRAILPPAVWQALKNARTSLLKTGGR
jgi:hypothetical protein